MLTTMLSPSYTLTSVGIFSLLFTSCGIDKEKMFNDQESFEWVDIFFLCLPFSTDTVWRIFRAKMIEVINSLTLKANKEISNSRF